MIKALFFDIDGTLVSFKTHQIPVSTIEALEAAKAKGIQIFISTGRPRVIINNLAALQERKLIDGYITMNGAYCFVDDTVIYKSPIPAAEVDALTSFCHERNLPCILVGEHDICVNQPGELVTEIFNRQLKTDPIPPKPYTDNHSDKEYYQLTPFIDIEEEQLLLPSIPNCEISCLCRYHRQRKYQTTRHRRDNPAFRHPSGRNDGFRRRWKRYQHVASCRHWSGYGQCQRRC